MEERTELYRTLMDALEKQIPYRPRTYPYYAGQCKCDIIFPYGNMKYCPNCGQRLKWDK